MQLQGLQGIEGLSPLVLPGPTLAAAPALDDVEIAAVARSLALTLAEIHERGYAHQNVEASRVVLDDDGAPVLCGAELCEPSDSQSDDVVQWGALLAHLLQWGAAADGAGFERPRTRRRRRLVSGEDEEVRLVLAELSDQAQDPDPARRPSAGALAHAIAHRIPAMRLPGPCPPSEPPRPTTIRPRPEESLLEQLAGDSPEPRWMSWRPLLSRRALALAAVGALTAVAVVMVPSVMASDESEPGESAAPPPPPTATDPCPPVAPPAADADGDGCEEPVTVEGDALVAGSLRFALGSKEDHVVLGDWDCDGRRTPALLTGATVAVYDEWPAPGSETHGRVVASVPGATTIAVSRTGECDVIVLTLPDASPRIVDPRPVP